MNYPGLNYLKNLKVCLKWVSASTLNPIYMIFYCLVKNLTCMTNTFIINISVLLYKNSLAKQKDSTSMLTKHKHILCLLTSHTITIITATTLSQLYYNCYNCYNSHNSHNCYNIVQLFQFFAISPFLYHPTRLLLNCSFPVVCSVLPSVRFVESYLMHQHSLIPYAKLCSIGVI